MKGKIEWDFVEDGAEEEKIQSLIKEAVSKSFRKVFSQETFTCFLKEFSHGDGWEVSEMTPSERYIKQAVQYPSITKHLAALLEESSPEIVSSGIEFILEGLSLSGRIKKEVRDDKIHYGKPL